jgi:hypothetical protein
VQEQTLHSPGRCRAVPRELLYANRSAESV